MLSGFTLSPSYAMTFASPAWLDMTHAQSVKGTEYHDLHISSALMENRQFVEAIPYLEAAREKGPTNLFATYNLGLCYYELAKASNNNPVEKTEYLIKAEAMFLRLQSLNPQISDSYFKLGKIAIQTNQMEDALSYYKIGLKLEPHNALLHFNIGWVYDQTENYDRALYHYSQAVNYDDKLSYAYNNMGLIHQERNEDKKAEIAYKKALNIDEQYNFARMNLGNLYSRLNRLSEAKAEFQKAVALEPENAWAKLYLGNVYFKQQDYENAVKFYQASIERNPGYVTTYYLMTLTLYKLDRKDDAMNFGLSYLSLDPDGNYSQEVKEIILSLKIQQAGGTFLKGFSKDALKKDPLKPDPQ
ncbi:MAG: tetratricopeptide repeat protein [Vampirovibrio sp.]|nr:tetratricopeptide repeat protein [Vampirovibrio sp.]